MEPYDPAVWKDFALAHVGASAALLGLVFVGITINLRDVVASRLLVNRAVEAIVLIGSVLIAATCVLIPAQPRVAAAVELAAVALITMVVVALLQRDAGADAVPAGSRGPTQQTVAVRRVLALGTGVLTLVAAVSLAAEAGGGMFWWAPAVVVAYVGALTDAWVITVEILR